MNEWWLRHVLTTLAVVLWLARSLACSRAATAACSTCSSPILACCHTSRRLFKSRLVNTWSLSKSEGAGNEKGGWHGGLEPRHYAVDVSGQIRTQMLNVVWSLTDNGPGDGDQSDAISCFN